MPGTFCQEGDLTGIIQNTRMFSSAGAEITAI